MADQYQVTTEGCDVQGTNNTGIATNHIVQYPKPPRRDDGKWLAIGSIVGSLVGVLYNKDKIDDASDAEDTWRDLTDEIKDKGLFLLKDHADKLLACSDALHEKICALAQCGYTAQYDAVRRVARADAALAAEAARDKACRAARRYHTGMNANVTADILRAEIAAATIATTNAVLAERDRAIKLNWEMTLKATQLIEADYLNRVQLGADLVASAGENYAYLAESLRKTAKEDVGDWTALGTALGVLLPILFNFGCPDDSYCDSCEPAPEEPSTPGTSNG